MAFSSELRKYFSFAFEFNRIKITILVNLEVFNSQKRFKFHSSFKNVTCILASYPGPLGANLTAVRPNGRFYGQ